MLKKDLILRHPLRALGFENDDIVSVGGFGAAMSRAGVGKTALLVQLALNSMLRGKKVLHVSLHDPVGKIALWYEELFQHLAEQNQLERMKAIWEEILPQRFIMTFKVEGFSVPRLEERMNDLAEQGIFRPDLIIVDGLHFDENVRGILEQIKTLIRKYEVRAWFTVSIHRHVEEGRQGLPVPILPVEDLFDVALMLASDKGNTRIRALKGSQTTGEAPAFVLDPSSMLIKDAS